MNDSERLRLIELYQKTGGGHIYLSEDDFKEYAALRKKEFQDRREELRAQGAREIAAIKDDRGDITGWTWVA